MIATLQLLALAGLLGVGLWGRRRDLADTACALLLLVWTDLVFTGLLLSCFRQLGNGELHVFVSLLMAAATAWFLRLDRSPIVQRPTESAHGRLSRGLAWVAILLVVIPTALICVYYHPNNADSVSYRFPRPFFFAGAGYLENANILDFRISSYPFDASLAYMPFALHGLAGSWFNLIGGLIWLGGGCAVRTLAREIGASRPAALFAAALFMTAPAVVTSVGAGNDDLIAGVPLAIGIVYGMRWWRSSSWLDAMLFAMGMGLSAGSKLHLPFLAPFGLLLGLFLLRELARMQGVGAFLRNRATQLFGIVLVSGLLVAPVLIINVKTVGTATTTPAGLVNMPFSMVSALTHTAIDTAELFLAPLPDLYIAPTVEQRRPVYDWVNGFVNRHLFYWVKPDLHYSHEGAYYFTTLTDSMAAYGVWEQSAWLGLLPWLLLIAFVLMVRRRAGPALWLAGAFFAWHVTRDFLIKYVDGAGIYYAFPAAFACAALAWLWDAREFRGKYASLVLRGLCLMVLATNLVSAVNLLLFNPSRNLPTLFKSGFRPNDIMVPMPAKGALERARTVFLPYTQWEYPFFNFMSVNPAAHFTTGSPLLLSPKIQAADLTLLLAHEQAAYGAEMPVRISHDDRTRFAPLGDIEAFRWDRELVFGRGPAMGDGWEADAHWTVLSMAEHRGGDGSLVGLSLGIWLGADPDEHYSGVLKAIDATGAIAVELPRMQIVEGTTIPLPPTVPKDGTLVLELEREDNPEIKAMGRLPIDLLASQTPGTLQKGLDQAGG